MTPHSWMSQSARSSSSSLRFSLGLTRWMFCFWTKCWRMFGLKFCCLQVFLLMGALFVGSWVDFGSLAEAALRSSNQDTLSTGLESHVLYDDNMAANLTRRRRSSDPAPLSILGPSHLPALKDLLSDRKITVRLGLRIAVTNQNELLEPQLQLLLNKQAGLYNVGNKAGLFFMKVREIKKVSTSS